MSSKKSTKDLKIPVTKQGNKDKRYKHPQFTKKDGTKDKRTTPTSERK